MTFDSESAGDAQKILASPKRVILENEIDANFLENKKGNEKLNIRNRLKRLLSKFHADRIHP